jgi:hypothetical protein
MLGRALSLATVTLLIGCFAADPARAQMQNLEAGKSPSQIFAGTCTACHKSPRGLLKTVPAGSLQGFLKQHYTTSPEMASLLAAFLVSNGAADTRYVGSQGKPGKDEKPEAKPSSLSEQLDRFGRRLRPAPPQEAAKPEVEPPREAAKPDADGIEPGRHGRNAKRLARPGEPPAAEGQAPNQAANERGSDGRKLSAKQKLSKRGKPAGEEPKSESAKTESGKTEPGKTESSKTEPGKEEPAKGEAAKEETPKNEPKTEPKNDTAKSDAPTNEPAKSETATSAGDKPEATKPSGEVKSESAKIDTPKETGSKDMPALRPDPGPPVTPPPAVSAAVTGSTTEPSAASSAPPPAQPAPAAATESAPPPPPIAPAGPPTPPISQ